MHLHVKHIQQTLYIPTKRLNVEDPDIYTPPLTGKLEQQWAIDQH